jgi:hypothetical protein
MGETIPDPWRTFVARCLCPLCTNEIGMDAYFMNPDGTGFVHAACFGKRIESDIRPRRRILPANKSERLAA